MKSVMVVRLEVEHRGDLNVSAEELAGNIAEYLADELSQFQTHRVTVRPRLESAVLHTDAGFTITPTTELLRALGL